MPDSIEPDSSSPEMDNDSNSPPPIEDLASFEAEMAQYVSQRNRRTLLGSLLSLVAVVAGLAAFALIAYLHRDTTLNLEMQTKQTEQTIAQYSPVSSELQGFVHALSIVEDSTKKAIDATNVETARSILRTEIAPKIAELQDQVKALTEKGDESLAHLEDFAQKNDPSLESRYFVYLYVPVTAKRTEKYFASQIQAGLRSAGYQTPPFKSRSNKGFKLPQPQVRYFREEDKANAQAVLALVRDQFGIPVELLPLLNEWPYHNRIEVWFTESALIKTAPTWYEMSGPGETPYKPSDGLALINDADLEKDPGIAEVFLPPPTGQKVGLAVRLNPKTYYIAIPRSSRSKLKGKWANVRNPRTEKTVKALAVDVYPDSDGAAVAVSPGVHKFLDLLVTDKPEISFEPAL